MKRRSTHVRDQQDTIISEIRKLTVSNSGIPDMKESEVIRRLLDAGIDAVDLRDLADDPDAVEPTAVEELVSEAALARYRHERFQELEGWLNNQRSGFRSQVARHFKRRFKNGFSPSELEDFAENMRRKAHYLWPGEDYSEEREEALAYVEAVVDHAVDAVEESDVDPLDPSSMFEDFEGVEEAQSRETVDAVRETETFERLVEDAVDRLDYNGVAPDRDAVAHALSKEYAVDPEVAESAVEQAHERLAESGGAVA